MAGFECNGSDCFGVPIGQISVDGFDLVTPAWQLGNLQKLWFEFEVRTDEILLPKADGRRSYPSRLDQSEYELSLYVNGEVDEAGLPFADPWGGLVQNLETLWANAFSPVTTGDGTRPAVLTLPDGVTTRTADVKLSPLRSRDDVEDPTFVTMRTTMTVPAGRFA